MSETDKTQPNPDEARQKRWIGAVAERGARAAQVHETQKERWIKYGANVAVASIVVIVLAGLIIYLAQLTRRRIDTTQAGMYSLKPQTVNIIQNLPGKIKLVSLYTPLQGATTDAGRAQQAEHELRMEAVADLLEEYQRKGKNIEVEVIDPVANPTKVDDLINEVTNKYGGEVAKYKQALDAYPAVYEKIRGLTTELVNQSSKLPMDAIAADQSQDLTAAAISSVQSFPALLKQSEQYIKRRLALKPPDYKGAANEGLLSVQSTMEALSEQSDQIVQIFAKGKDDKKLPEQVRTYMTDSAPTYQQIKAAADELLAKVKGLGELKLDELRQKLNEQNAILVLGENDMRSLSEDQVWTVDASDARRFAPGEQIKPRFAGEQQISTAILSLTTAKKPKVAFIRASGPPLASSGPFMAPGPLSIIASRLRDYNFEVLEKDLSGQWAMQAQMRGQPAEPEPTDEQLKDAVWIVLSLPSGQMGPMGPPPSVAPRVAEHLKAGGSALLMFLPQSDNMEAALKDWGISVDTSVVAVHEMIKSPAGPSADMIEEAQRVPFIFVLRNYGDHPLTKPLQSLDMLMLQAVPVKTTDTANHTVTPLLPLPSEPRTWGERNIEQAMSADPVTFDEKSDAPGGGDVPGPLFVGAASERKDGGRVVAIGSIHFVTNQILQIPDPELAQRRILVSRFPANAELVANSVFWLSKMETMIAISPAAMEVSRIGPMSDATLKAWRVGGLLIGLPGAVIVAGALVYFARRD